MAHSDRDRLNLLTRALDHLQSALELLDSAAAPAHIGAHVDFALNQLLAEIANGRGSALEEPAARLAHY